MPEGPIINITMTWTPPITDIIQKFSDAGEVVLYLVSDEMARSLSEMTSRLIDNAPVGATGLIRSGIAATQSLDIPDAEAFMNGTPATATVGFPKVGYEEYAERGRGPGRFPPEGPIISWLISDQQGRGVLSDYMSRHNITNRALGLRRLAFLIRRRHSVAGTKFPSHAVRITRDQLEPEFTARYQEIGEAIGKLLDAHFGTGK